MLWHAYALLSHGGDRIGLRFGRIHGRPRMCRHPDDVLRIFDQADEAVWSANTLSACAESGLIGLLAEPRDLEDIAVALSMPPPLARSLVEVLESFGLVVREENRIRAAPALLPYTTPEGARAFRAALQAPLLQADDFRTRAAGAGLNLDGWTHTDRAIIEAQGSLTALWARQAVPKLKFLPGLAARLDAPDAALLDVGAGAAGLSIALCRAFPHLKAVALEPAPSPAAIGDERIRDAGLEDRIALRRQRVEHLEDRECFDLAFLPQMFLPDAIMEETVNRIFHALRPGGWLLTAILTREGPGVAAAVSRLKNLLWGGNTRGMDEMRQRLQAAGFDPVIRAPGARSMRMICARRPIARASA